MTKLTDTAETVLARRYYLKDENGNPIENWQQLCLRVAKHVAGGPSETEAFYSIIRNLAFLPNSPCLMNAGTELGQLSACFVLPVEDSMEGIFRAVYNGALVHKTGGGTGYSFSRLRARNAAVKSTQGVASGPLSFMEVFNTATETIKQGGKRRGANMAVLRCDHPDILDFIDAKEDPNKFTNFNFSVALTDEFMASVVNGELSETAIFNRIVDRAWRTGEPGVLFIDEVNRHNPTPQLGDIEASNPCGEQFLLPYESCNLGSINLGNFVKDGVVDSERLQKVTRLAVQFLDRVVDINKYPIPEIEEMSKKTRKIGLGIMGLHDMLIQLGIPYASEEGRQLASDVMGHVRAWAYKESSKRSRTLGPYPAHPFKGAEDITAFRNAALTSIQPTGTVSMIADCSSGCEPYFALVTVKNVMDGDRLLMVNKHFERIAREKGFYSEALMSRVAERGTVVGDPDVPEKWQEVFRCAQDISPEDHILMQAALQQYVDSGISKTINMPASATRKDVEAAYILAWERGCKGLTVYRDGCREGQVLNAGVDKPQEPTMVNTSVLDKLELPDLLDAKRYRIKGQDGEKMYVILCFDENKQPVEVFAKFPFDNRVELREMSTMWTTVCRLASIALRHRIPVAEIIKQLERSSGSMFDLPAQLSQLLKMFAVTTGDEATVAAVAAPCPDCGQPLVFAEGCETCKSCGFSKCS